jgi:APA family basic amino acid/polyamine antiporter
VPVASTLFTGVLVAVISFIFDLDFLANVISCGTLQVFTFVNAGVVLLRIRSPSRGPDITTRLMALIFAVLLFSLSFVLKWHWIWQIIFAGLLVLTFWSIQSLEERL